MMALTVNSVNDDQVMIASTVNSKKTGSVKRCLYGKTSENANFLQSEE